MVESGTVRLVVDGDDAGAKTLGPGDFFGARALLGDGTQPASAIAAGPVSCAAMTGADFERLLGPCRDVLAKAEA